MSLFSKTLCALRIHHKTTMACSNSLPSRSVVAALEIHDSLSYPFTIYVRLQIIVASAQALNYYIVVNPPSAITASSFKPTREAILS